MTIGERIRELRIKANLTQEELGEKLGVQKSAILKYEKGSVENIKRSTIKRMATIFDVTPSFLMCWDDDFNADGKLESEVHLIEQIQKQYGSDIIPLIDAYTSLNLQGRAKLIDFADDLSIMDKYKK